jgi:catechol 2,3-dioxygenase-like lactoylglutathione lyase family enzyme
MTINFTRAIPIMRIFSVEKAKEFYLDWLGFKVDWEHEFEENMPKYIQISRGNLILHLSEHHGDACPGATAVVVMEGIEEFQAEISAKKYKYNRPGLQIAPWKMKFFEVVDPFGNRIRFNERMD